MRNSKAAPERERIAVFRSGKKKETLDTWRYWEIVGALQWMGADRLTAYDTAKWIQQAKPGDTRTAQPGIDIQILEKEKNNV